MEEPKTIKEFIAYNDKLVQSIWDCATDIYNCLVHKDTEPHERMPEARSNSLLDKLEAQRGFLEDAANMLDEVLNAIGV